MSSLAKFISMITQKLLTWSRPICRIHITKIIFSHSLSSLSQHIPTQKISSKSTHNFFSYHCHLLLRQ